MSWAADRLIELHRLRVRSEVGHRHRDYFAHPWEREMLAVAMQGMARSKGGFIATLEVDGVEVAAQAFLTRGHRLVVHYSGFDPEFARFSPLLVLQAEIFRSAQERGVREIDLMFGSARWQTRWGAEPTSRELQTTMLSPRPLSLARAAVYALRREAAATWRRQATKRGWHHLQNRLGERAATLTGAWLQFHHFLVRTAATPAFAHHVTRFHR
jgi:CelD/BcsL family acetyltransferase involved in cellulose biosynthesis